MNQEKIGKLISIVRKEKNLTQEQLAEKLNVSKNAVSKWERGLNLPDVSIMKDLCKELDITLNELFNGEKIKDEEYKKIADDNLFSALNGEYITFKLKIGLFGTIIGAIIGCLIGLFVSIIFKIDLIYFTSSAIVFLLVSLVSNAILKKSTIQKQLLYILFLILGFIIFILCIFVKVIPDGVLGFTICMTSLYMIIGSLLKLCKLNKKFSVVVQNLIDLIAWL